MKTLKRIFLILLIIPIVLAALALIFKDQAMELVYNWVEQAREQREWEERSPIITREELSITLSKDFDTDIRYNHYGNETVYVSDDHLVGLYTAKIKDITIEGNPPPSLKTYASCFFPIWVGDYSMREIPLSTVDGMLCYEADLNADGKPDNFVFFFETKTSFYFVRMTYNKDTTTYEQSRDQFIAWAKTITFSDSKDN